MKKIIKIFLIICALGYAHLGYAQYCEFDSVGAFGQTRFDGLIQLPDNSFLIAGRYGIGGQPDDGFTAYKQAVFVRKVDTCNQQIWEIILDSATSRYDYFQTRESVPKVLKKQDGFYLLSMGIHSGKDTVYKFDAEGKYASTNPADKALFGSAMGTNKYYVFESLGDSIGIIHKDSNVQIIDTLFIYLAGFKPIMLELKKTNSNSINLLVKSQSNDSNYKWLIIDSLGRKWYDLELKSESGKLVQLAFNASANGLFGLAELPGGKNFNLIKYNAQGGVLNKYSLNSLGIKDYAFLHAAGQGILFRFDHISMVFDAELNLLKTDTLQCFYDLERPFIYAHNAILSDDNQVFHTGFLESRGGIASFPRYRTWIKKSYSVTYVKSLSIEGPNSIFIRDAFVRLNSLITPSNASNKTLIWSVDDTSKAHISQIGFLSFRKHGTVMVQAQTTDGSMIVAQKSIFIYPALGLLSNENDFNILLFPNPANTTVQIESKEHTIENSYLTDLAGKIIQDFGSNHTLDVSQIANGIYLLHVTSPKGQTVKKLWIDK